MKIFNRTKDKSNKINKFIFLYMIIGGILGGVLGYCFVKFVLKF